MSAVDEPAPTPRRPGTAALAEEELLVFLRSVPALRDAEAGRLREVLALLNEAVVPPGHVLMKPGESGVVLLLLEGTADVSGPQGSRIIGPGALVGGDGVVGVTPGAEVTARTPVVAFVVAADRLARCMGRGKEGGRPQNKFELTDRE